MRGTVLTIATSQLPELPDGEYYHSDLLGLAAISQSGEPIGKVVAVENFGATDIIEIERPGEGGQAGKRFMIPMSPAAVADWNAATLVVTDDFADV